VLLPKISELIGFHFLALRSAKVVRSRGSHATKTGEPARARASQVSSARLGDGAEGWLRPLVPTTTASVCRLHDPNYGGGDLPVKWNNIF
jgi:hypothetical protein